MSLSDVGMCCGTNFHCDDTEMVAADALRKPLDARNVS
jgi:hypothetical protein